MTDGPSGPARAVLDRLEATAFERPAAAGGLGLGLTAGVLVSEELGRAARGNPYRADALAADTGGPAGAALAGLEALPAGTGITASPRDGGWELSGTATVDAPDAGRPLLVATRTDAGPVLVAVPAGAPGVRVDGTCWPPVVRLDATPVGTADVVGGPAEAPAGPLARARLRQAAYLLGIADGAHRIAVRHAGTRRQFDTRLRDLPAVAFPLARATVALRATRAAVYRGAWLVDTAGDRTDEGTGAEALGAGAVGTAPVVALATAAETARDVVRLCMQSCGVRAMTSELGLHRHFRLAAAESNRYGEPAALWRLAGAARLDLARRAAGENDAGRTTVAAGRPERS
ncbi:acyl-CoA dehydrogenase family protein [Streptomyces roseicoloratus]|uniref:Acyl-CoA dehydrogenase family protein n=1 Tax=Streptomyces roseicoloratus TaxID=2508722 RepID=A0ABY9RP72_9ACTN|nr:acyl-CoA dehydrogenase family protein [Streptomyces roseicoloratus]WMX43986.1 acyl-CoA dehydrogenase family protein [Streptomyces roseicoloratus]